eukprot:315511-Amphidinium_carterae.1
MGCHQHCHVHKWHPPFQVSLAHMHAEASALREVKKLNINAAIIDMVSQNFRTSASVDSSVTKKLSSLTSQNTPTKQKKSTWWKPAAMLHPMLTSPTRAM